MYNILIVDDEPFMLTGLKQIINWAEYGIDIVGTASNGIKALDIIKQERVDILLTDIRMQEMDGIGLIKEIRRQNLNIKVIVLSGYDDFQYLKEATQLGIENYLLKPVNTEELSSTLQNITNKIDSEIGRKIQYRCDLNIIRENVLYRWVTNNISPVEFTERAKFLDIDISGKNYLVALVRVLDVFTKTSSEGAVNTGLVNNPSLLGFAVKNIYEENFHNIFGCEIFNVLNGDVVLIFRQEMEFNPDKLESLLKESALNVSKFLKVSTFTTIGVNAHSSNEVHLSYNTALELMSYSLVFPVNSVIRHSDVQRNNTDINTLYDIDFETFRRILTSKETDKAIDFVDSVFRKLKGTDGLKPWYLQNISTEIIFIINSTLSSSKLNVNSILDDSDNILKDMLYLPTMDELCQWIKNITIKAISVLQKHDSNLSPLVKRALDYIELNYSKDVSLKILSNTFCVNASYLGQLFKSETGELFSNYVHKIRIEKSKLLLQNSKLNISEIASQVGYCNQNYFCNTFKKFTGLHPTSYKRNLKA